jgi:hypothetical protein
MGICNSRASQPEETDLNLINYQDELRHLYVVTVLINPARSRNSIKHYTAFKQQVEKAGAKLITVECVIDNCPFTVTIPNYEPYNIQIKTSGHFFQRERLFNIALSKLPLDAKYVVLADAEVEFVQETWATDAIKALHVVKVIQLFEDISLLGPNKEELKKIKGFGALNFKKENNEDKEAFEESTQGAGYAWGFKVDFLKEQEGIIDYCPLGNNDKLIAYALQGRVEDYVPKEKVFESFRDALKNWQKKAHKQITDGVGFIPGLIKVSWSNSKREKASYEKWDILQNNEFDHRNDLIVKEDGSYELDSQKTKLVTELKDHFTSLNGENIQ